MTNSKEVKARTLYVTNLPMKKKQKGYLCTSDDIKNMFDNKDSISNVKLQFGSTGENSGKDAAANGCATVEFDTMKQRKAAAAQHISIKGVKHVKPAKELKLKGKVIDVISVRDYIDQAKANKKRKAESLGSDEEEKVDEKEVDKKKKKVDEKKKKDDEKKKKDDGKKKDNEKKKKDDGKKKKDDEKKTMDDKKNADEEGNARKEKPYTLDWKPGCVISVKGLSRECDREAVVEALATALDKSDDDLRTAGVYIDYSRGDPDGAVRFPEPCDDIATVIKKFGSGDVKVKDAAVSVALLEGDDEKNYFEKFIELKKRLINRPRENRQNRRKRHLKKRKI